MFWVELSCPTASGADSVKSETVFWKYSGKINGLPANLTLWYTASSYHSGNLGTLERDSQRFLLAGYDGGEDMFFSIVCEGRTVAYIKVKRESLNPGVEWRGSMLIEKDTSVVEVAFH